MLPRLNVSSRRVTGRIVGLVAGLALVAAACGGGDQQELATGELETLAGGGQLDMGSLEGRDVVLWF